MVADSAENDVAEPRFGFPVGPWFRWFAWHPTETTDRGWRWLRPVWRRRYQTHDYLDGPTLTWFTTRVFPPAEPEPHDAARPHRERDAMTTETEESKS